MRRFDTELKQTDNGAWLITRGKDEYYDSKQSGQLTTKRHLNVKSIKVNEPIADAIFTLNVPGGTDVFDTSTGRQYTTPPPNIESVSPGGYAWIVTGSVILASGILLALVAIWMRKKRHLA